MGFHLELADRALRCKSAMPSANLTSLCACSQFFQSGKALPIERGAGADQPVMHAVARVVALGRWLHIFPEGKVNYTGQLAPLRWGVGKIICDAIGRHGAK